MSVQFGGLRRSISLATSTTTTATPSTISAPDCQHHCHHSIPIPNEAPGQKGSGDWLNQPGTIRRGLVKPVHFGIDTGAPSPTRVDDEDMPPHPTKLGERLPGINQRPLTADSQPRLRVIPGEKRRSASARLSTREGHAFGETTRGSRVNPVALEIRSPGSGVGEGPIEFNKMPKPAGWQGQQVVEIRRDWIMFLATGLGIDTTLYSSPELENQLARKMLEQAERNFFESSSEEWDTDDDEDTGSDYWDENEGTDPRRGRSGGIQRGQSCRSRSRSRGRRAAVPVGSGNSSRDSSGRPRRPRSAGVLGRVLRRAQTTGDVGRRRSHNQDGKVRRDKGATRHGDGTMPKHGSALTSSASQDGDPADSRGTSSASVLKGGDAADSRDVSSAKGSGSDNGISRHRTSRSSNDSSLVGSALSSGSPGRVNGGGGGGSSSISKSGVSSRSHLNAWRQKISSEGVARAGVKARDKHAGNHQVAVISSRHAVADGEGEKGKSIGPVLDVVDDLAPGQDPGGPQEKYFAAGHASPDKGNSLGATTRSGSHRKSSQGSRDSTASNDFRVKSRLDGSVAPTEGRGVGGGRESSHSEPSASTGANAVYGGGSSRSSRSLIATRVSSRSSFGMDDKSDRSRKRGTPRERGQRSQESSRTPSSRDGSRERHESSRSRRQVSSNDVFVAERARDRSRERSSEDHSWERSSGDRSRERSSGDRSRERSSEDCSRERSSGDRSRERSSGDRSREPSSGDRSRERLSRDCSRERSSGECSLERSSGNRSRNRLGRTGSHSRRGLERDGISRKARDQSRERSPGERSRERLDRTGSHRRRGSRRNEASKSGRNRDRSRERSSREGSRERLDSTGSHRRRGSDSLSREESGECWESARDRRRDSDLSNDGSRKRLENTGSRLRGSASRSSAAENARLARVHGRDSTGNTSMLGEPSLERKNPNETAAGGVGAVSGMMPSAALASASSRSSSRGSNILRYSRSSPRDAAVEAQARSRREKARETPSGNMESKASMAAAAIVAAMAAATTSSSDAVGTEKESVSGSSSCSRPSNNKAGEYSGSLAGTGTKQNGGNSCAVEGGSRRDIKTTVSLDSGDGSLDGVTASPRGVIAPNCVTAGETGKQQEQHEQKQYQPHSDKCCPTAAADLRRSQATGERGGRAGKTSSAAAERPALKGIASGHATTKDPIAQAAATGVGVPPRNKTRDSSFPDVAGMAPPKASSAPAPTGHPSTAPPTKSSSTRRWLPGRSDRKNRRPTIAHAESPAGGRTFLRPADGDGDASLEVSNATADGGVSSGRGSSSSSLSLKSGLTPWVASKSEEEGENKRAKDRLPDGLTDSRVPRRRGANSSRPPPRSVDLSSAGGSGGGAREGSKEKEEQEDDELRKAAAAIVNAAVALGTAASFTVTEERDPVEVADHVNSGGSGGSPVDKQAVLPNSCNMRSLTDVGLSSRTGERAAEVASGGSGGSGGHFASGMPTKGTREFGRERSGEARSRRGEGSATEGGGVKVGKGIVIERDESTASLVQSTGAAAAAGAPADDGGYGRDWDKLEMHRAVYANDLAQLRYFISERPRGLKQIDHHANTPLLLALKLARTEMAWLMIRAGADLDVPSDGSFQLLDEAIVLGDEDLLVEVYGRLQRKSWAKWRDKVPHLLDLLEDEIPDFYMEMHWSFECSNVLAPIVKAVAPHDQYRIWKKGSWLRMDSTITGYTKRLKTQRGNVSLVFLGKDSPAPGALIKLDHEKKKVYNVLRRLESPTPSEVRRTCRRYLSSGHSKRMANQVDSFVIKSSDLDFRPVRDGHGKTKTVKVGKWACEMHECTGDMQLQTFRKGPGDNLLAGISMKEYFDVRQTLHQKVLKAAGGIDGAPGTTSLFSFGDRSRENQKAKILAKFSTPHRRYEKKIKASMCMSQRFPLTLEHVTPMLEVMSMQDKVIQKLKEVLTTKGMREAGFPAKVSLPLYLGVFAVVSFDNCRVYERGELDPELFLVNPEYESSRRMRKGVYEGVMPGGVKVAKRGAGEIDSSAVTTVTASSTSASTSGEDRCNAYPPANIAGGKLPYKVWKPSDGNEPLAKPASALPAAFPGVKGSSSKHLGGHYSGGRAGASIAGENRRHDRAAGPRSMSISIAVGAGRDALVDGVRGGVGAKGPPLTRGPSGAWVKGLRSQSVRGLELNARGRDGMVERGIGKGLVGGGGGVDGDGEVEDDSLESEGDDDDEEESDEEADPVLQI